MTFEGIYFDGKSSAGYPATINFHNFGLQISYRADGVSKSADWEPEKIHKTDFAESGKVYLKYGNFPFQYIEVNQPGFALALKETYPNAKFHKSAYGFLFSTGFAGLVTLAALFVGLLALAYFVLLPAAAEKIAVQVPVSWEKQLGDAAYQQMVAESEIDEDNTKRLNSFFKQLRYKSQYDVEPVVVKDKIVNAYALPGGRIVVYEGILRTMNSSDELAALLSHEFSHVELKHSTKNIFRSMSSYLLISLLFGDASGITAVVLENANQLKQLGYSRELEHEADENGLVLMKQRKINPEGMKNLFEALKQEEGDSPDYIQFLSTHPLTTERISFVNKEIAKKNYSVEYDGQLDSLFNEIKQNLSE